MDNIVKMNCFGLKCDNESCDFVDNSIQLEDYPNWVNKPCPKCRENLLTEADYNNVMTIVAITKIINENPPKVDENDLANDKEVKLSVNMNGTGKMKFNLSDN